MKRLSLIKKLLIDKISSIKRKSIVFPDDITIIPSNCVGGMLYKNYSNRFLSPFINTLIFPSDFSELVKNFDTIDLTKIKFIDFEDSKYFGTSVNFSINRYPVALLDNTTIEVHFMHDRDIDDIELKWSRRCKRINYNHLVFILDDRRKISDETLHKISSLVKDNLYYFTCDKLSTVKNSIFIGSNKSYLSFDWINRIEYYLGRKKFNEIFTKI